MPLNVFRIMYYTLVVVCLIISLFLTYYGFERNFGHLTLPFTIVIGIGLFGADILIQRVRETGSGLAAPLALFMLFAVFSAVSNFNYLYTNFMEGDVLKQTIREEYGKFRNDLVKTRSKLLSMPVYIQTLDRQANLERELQLLQVQINDPNRPGCGERCRQHMDKIQGFLDGNVTPIAVPGTGSRLDDVNQWYFNYRKMVLESFSTGANVPEVAAVRTVVGRIEAQLTQYRSAEDIISGGAGLDLLAKLRAESTEIERLANSLLEDDVVHHSIDPTLGRLGEIVYSLQNGFYEMPNAGATIMSAILAVVVDLFPIFFALVAFRPGERVVGARAVERRRGNRVL